MDGHSTAAAAAVHCRLSRIASVPVHPFRPGVSPMLQFQYEGSKYGLLKYLHCRFCSLSLVLLSRRWKELSRNDLRQYFAVSKMELSGSEGWGYVGCERVTRFIGIRWMAVASKTKQSNEPPSAVSKKKTCHHSEDDFIIAPWDKEIGWLNGTSQLRCGFYRTPHYLHKIWSTLPDEEIYALVCTQDRKPGGA